MLPHLSNGWQVDQSILAEEDRVVLIRFGHDWDPSCMRMDEVRYHKTVLIIGSGCITVHCIPCEQTLIFNDI